MPAARGLLQLLLLLAAPSAAAAADCADSGADCTKSKCCAQDGQQCFQKDDYWAACMDWCSPGEPQEGDTTDDPWTCTVLDEESDKDQDPDDEADCAAEGQDCSESRCCADSSLQCYEKNSGWAGCKPSCEPGVDSNEDDGQPWSCKLLSGGGESDEVAIVDDQEGVAEKCADAGEDCGASKCCNDEGFKCFKKDEYWASCKESCTPGVDPSDEDQVPWTCDVLGAAPAPAPPPGPSDEGDEGEAKPGPSEQCVESGGDCTNAQCCQALGEFCFQKDAYFAQCNQTCTMAPDKDGVSWTCQILMSSKASDVWDEADGKARWLLEKLRPEAKTAFLHGAAGDDTADAWGYAGLVNPQVETRVPKEGEEAADILRTALTAPLRFADGAQGFSAPGSPSESATKMPGGLALAATFDPQAAIRYAKGVAAEFQAKGANVFIGPDITVVRAPLAGRSYQSIAGEDPYLGSEMVKPFVKTLQDAGIIAAVKHWLNSNEDTYKKTVNIAVDKRTQREIYTRPFEAAFAAGAGAVVCPFNKVNGQHVCESQELLKDLLRDTLGFRGFVVSEWGAVQNLEASALAGLDMQMPGGNGGEFSNLVNEGKLAQDELEDKVVHVLGSMYAAGHFNDRFEVPRSLIDAEEYNTPKEQRAAAMELLSSDVDVRADGVAVQTIVESAVLLKNADGTLPIATDSGRIALVGKCAEGAVGDRSNRVLMHTALTSLQDALMDSVGKTMEVESSGDASAVKGDSIAVVCALAPAAEEWDRSNLTLPDMDWLISESRKNGAKTVIVLAVVPGAVTTEWLDAADAALLFFAPGDNFGPAATKLLVGDAAPGGRLPVTLPEVDENRFKPSQYPGECEGENKWCEDLTANFSEQNLVGYRWNDAKGAPAAFPFGFGLTYTEFKFDDFKVDCSDDSDSVEVQLTITNVGGRDGTAVPQLYVEFDSLRPAKRQLRGFRKVMLPAGGQMQVLFVLHKEDWSFFDESTEKWKSAADSGDFITVHLGSSSADLQWKETLSCDFLTLTDNSGLLRPLVMGPP